VFFRDGLYYHAKGATPAWTTYAADTNGLTMILLNMAEPILIVRGKDNPNGLGFSPHGAGRNFSRTAYLRRHEGRTAEEMIAEQAPGIDVRYFCGVPDLSELPGAYKNAAAMRAQIERFGLAEIVDEIDPVGNIMAGDWQRDAPWRRKKPRRADRLGGMISQSLHRGDNWEQIQTEGPPPDHRP
jgi:tRNA-splicing ligase RtcB (3'-phosphate/5'-hydroxy nucleic acid ligase)